MIASADLWSFSLRLYAAPGVADACLEAQDQYGADVNLLLWAAWLAVQGHELTMAEVAEAEAVTRPWRDEVVRPLRAVRRQLKSGPPPAPDAATESLRAQVKATELEAERMQQSLLQHLPAERRTGGAVADLLRTNLSFLPGGSVLVDTKTLQHVVTQMLQSDAGTHPAVVIISQP